MNKRPESINCSHCAAPLQVSGGQRVNSLTCQYCGTVMDANNGYKEVKRWDDFNTELAKYSPLSLGATGRFEVGKFRDVDFTIIGIMVYRTVGEGDRWLEYQLYSPTHGYYFLVFEDGHWLFVRKVRERPSKFYPITKAQFAASGRKYTVFESYQAELVQVVGETTWEANVGDRSKNTLGIDPPYSFEIEKTEGETEYFFGHYLSAEEVEQAFGDVKTRKPNWVHPVQPYTVRPTLAALSSTAKPFALLAIAALIGLLVFGRGDLLYKQHLVPNALEEGEPLGAFEVADPKKMLHMYLDSSLSNSWSWYHLEILNADTGQVVYDVSKELSYYHGGSGDDAWSEGSTSATLYFKAPQAGRYSIALAESSGGRGNASSGAASTLKVEIRQGVLPKFYFVMLAIIFAIFAALNWLHRRRFESKRWGEIDDDE